MLGVSWTTRNVWSAAVLQAKNESGVLVCANVSGLCWSKTPGLNGMRCALVLFSFSALIGFFRVQVSRAPGSTVVPSHGSPANLAGNHNSVSRRRWSAIVGIADAISKLGVYCRASIAGQCFIPRQLAARAEADRLLPWSAPPKPCAPSYWLTLP